ncbi:hypothetical protein ATANTOWER_026888 [Ataeniobius toweri]|uniref:NADH dehydrogenase subunit 6 n=1 Tax=Ataeniobius toweri TaxID=208326 RepID=A0ABU7B084_9TELE|nr:hypothetical protein [Ataeniobius toweri]
MCGRQHLDRLSGDGEAELVSLSLCAVVAVAVLLRRHGGRKRPRVHAADRDCLLREFALSWCGVRGSVVSTVLGGVCSVALLGRGWGGITQGPLLPIAARCVVEGDMRQGCLEQGCVRSLHCVDVSSSAFWGGAHLWGCAPVERGFMAFGFMSMCSISVSWLGVTLWGISCWGSWGVGGSWH